MAFVFRLEKVLTLRREDVEKAQLQVILAQKALKEMQNLILRTIEEIKTRNQDLINNNYNMAQDHLRVIRKLNEKLTKLKEEEIQLKRDLDNKKKILLEAQKKVETLEKFKERQEEEYKTEVIRLEQKQTDEKATLKFTTEMMLKAHEEIYS